MKKSPYMARLHMDDTLGHTVSSTCMNASRCQPVVISHGWEGCCGGGEGIPKSVCAHSGLLVNAAVRAPQLSTGAGATLFRMSLQMPFVPMRSISLASVVSRTRKALTESFFMLFALVTTIQHVRPYPSTASHASVAG